MPLCPVETLQRLVRTPSVNPMGRDVIGPTIGEGRMTDLLVEICDGQNWNYTRQRVHAGRDNLLIEIPGDVRAEDGGEFLLWDVHQDTVPVDGMTVDPFGGERREGRVYGRGACDVKGSMAAMLAALSRRTRERNSEPSPSPSLRGRGNTAARPTILLACTANEECGFTGAQALVREWHRTPDAAIVAEPTCFDVVVAHQGVVRWRLHALGRAAHSSRPDEGVNAVYAMSRVVGALERFHRELSATSAGHPLCGRPSLCVSTIHGGVGINTVPERATIEVDRRLSPGESPDAARAAVELYVAENVDLGGCRLVHEPPFMQSAGLNDVHNRPLAEHVAGFARQFGGAGKIVGVPFGTDAAAISAAGVPTVVFGPGSIGNAHTADEFIEVAELELATEVFYRIACVGLR